MADRQFVEVEYIGYDTLGMSLDCTHCFGFWLCLKLVTLALKGCSTACHVAARQVFLFFFWVSDGWGHQMSPVCTSDRAGFGPVVAMESIAQE